MTARETASERVERIRAEVARLFAAKHAARKPGSGPAPRYDDVFWEGLKWLESL